MKCLGISALLMVLSVSAQSQGFDALETTADARMLALGQSTVADISGPIAGIGNPATLTGVRGTEIFYQDRWLDYYDWTRGYRLRAYGIATKTSIGTFSLSYRKFDKGEADITEDQPTPQGYIVVGRVRAFEYVGALSYAFKIGDPIVLGVTGKLDDIGLNWIWGGPSPTQITPAYLFDAGIFFRTPAFFSSNRITDELRMGISLENFGTDMKASDPSDAARREYSYRAPRFWRVGFSWLLAVKSNSDFEFLGLMIDGQYSRKWLPEEEVNYWGVGMEFRLLTVVAVRVGREIQPYESLFGKANKMNLRTGVGVRLSPKQFGYSIPLSVSFDYASMHLNDNAIAPFPWGLTKNRLTAYAVSISYELPLF
jgi:hypothetical protein